MRKYRPGRRVAAAALPGGEDDGNSRLACGRMATPASVQAGDRGFIVFGCFLQQQEADDGGVACQLFFQLGAVLGELCIPGFKLSGLAELARIGAGSLDLSLEHLPEIGVLVGQAPARDAGFDGQLGHAQASCRSQWRACEKPFRRREDLLADRVGLAGRG